MRVVVTIEGRFLRTPDGSVWTRANFAYSFWTRYLDVFDEVRVVTRTEAISSPPAGCHRVDGPHVSVYSLPNYQGPREYLAVRGAVRRALVDSIRPGDAVILRIMSTIANELEPILYRAGYPFGAEIVSDPFDAFSAGSVTHPLRNLFRAWFTLAVRRQTKRAYATAYVTREALQRRYPPAGGSFTTHYSSIELGSDAFARTVSPRGSSEVTRLLTIGSLDQLYKGTDVLIDAMGLLVADGLDVRLRIVGDGKHRAELESRVAALGLSDRVMFVGLLPAGEAVRRELAAADVFVLPSRSEGLPRALIEAMAYALPAIGTSAGGIPELLEPAHLAVPGDVRSLVGKIQALIRDEPALQRARESNVQVARGYSDDVLRERRRAFYRSVLAGTAAAPSALTFPRR